MDIFINQYFDFSVMRDNFGYVLHGLWLTIQLALISGTLALVWGLVLALLRSTPGRLGAILRIPAIAYINVMRSLPLLLVVLMIAGSLPFLTFLPEWLRAPHFVGLPDVFWYGVLSITVTYGAYYAEVYRAGLDAVPVGQLQAARSLGMSHLGMLRLVQIPQAIRKVVPPLLNTFTMLMKDTALVQVLGLVEVVGAGREIQAEEFNSSALTLAAVFFLMITVPLAMFIDRRVARQQGRLNRV